MRLPARAAQKSGPPFSSWKIYQSRLPSASETARWFADADGVCLICGAVSGNLEMLDFDLGGEFFQAWYEAVESADPNCWPAWQSSSRRPAAGMWSTAASRQSTET